MDLPRQHFFDRMVKLEQNDYLALKVGLVFWVASTYWFKKQYFLKDQNMFNWVLFSAGSFVSSVSYAKFFLETPYSSAAKINNEKEISHQRTLGNM